MTDKKQPQIKFVNFHGHSNASIYDGLGYPSEHLEYAYENGLEALALTDHGNMNNMVHQFLHSKKMKEQDRYVKPLYGVEAYFLPSMQEWILARSGEEISDDDNSATIIEDEDSKTEKVDKKILNRRRHLVLLAKNQTGLYNIFNLVSKSYQTPNFYRFPRMDYEMLREHSEGIIATSACLGGVYAGDYWENKDAGDEAVLAAMRNTTENMLEIFGDDWYGELQWNYIEDQHKLNQFVIKVCEEYDVKLVSTADAHYPRPELWKYRELYKRLGWKSMKEEAIPENPKELGYTLYPKNGDQMFKEYLRTSKELGFTYDHELILDSIERTHEIAFSKIEDFEPNTDVRLPSFILDKREDPDLQLRELVFKALKEKNLEDDVYITRLERELKVLKDTKFSKYFLAMNAVSKEAQVQQLTGPGRGSAGGSLIAYLLDITEIDPIRWGTQFERFLRSDSKDMPDIDYDVEDPMEFKNYLIERWGEYSVVPISTVSTLKMKSLIKSISKYYGVDFSEVNDITTIIDQQAIPKAKEKHGITAGVYNPTFEEYKEFSPALSEFLEQYPEIEEPIQTIFKQPFAIGRHAGGVVISENLNQYMPLISSKGVVQTPWSEGQNVRHLEPMGFIKFDLLGLTTLRMIRDCISNILEEQLDREPTFEEIKKFYRENLHIDKLNVNDPKVFDNVFKKGVFPSIFQFTKKNAQDFCVSVAPENLIDISIITSIYRPGPLSADVDKKFIEARKNSDSIIYKHEKLKKITEPTSGFLVFQEQISAIAHELGKDISLDDANQLRKVLTKKGTGKEDKVKTSLYNRFIDGCIENGLSEEDGKKFWEDMEFFSGYGFNKSHAIAYSLISYQCAWLFTYYPDQWFVAILNNADEKFINMNIAKKLGYKIEKPNINFSGKKWRCENKTLFQPLLDVKGLGASAVDEILEKRPFHTIEDIFFNKDVKKAKLKKSNLEALARIGALDSLYDKSVFTSKAHFIAVLLGNPRSMKSYVKLLEDEELKNLPEISEDEQIKDIFRLTKDYPLELVLDEEIITELEENEVNPVSEYDSKRAHWFVATGYTEKTTKKNKSYWVIEGIDSMYQPFTIKVWSVYPAKDVLHLNKLYIIKKGALESDEKWGLSTGHKSPFYKSFVCVNG